MIFLWSFIFFQGPALFWISIHAESSKIISNLTLDSIVAVGDSWGIYPRTKIGEIDKGIKDQTSANTKIYVETLKGKTTEGREGFQYNSWKITMVIALSYALGFLGFVDRPPRWKRSTIYTCGCFLYKISESDCIWIYVLSQLLTLEAVGAEHSNLNLQGTHLSLSSGPRPVVDMLDLPPACNRRVQIKIWFEDKGTCNRLSLSFGCLNCSKFRG